MNTLTPHEKEILRLWGVIRKLQDQMMEKPVAVVSSNYYETLNWIRNNWDVVAEDQINNRIRLKDGRTLVIINNREGALGWEFSDYLIAPNYSTLVDVVKSRIR
jgi:hypothetical protein